MSKIVLIIHSLIFGMKKAGIPLLPDIINKLFIRLLFGCQLGSGTRIGKGVNLAYGGLGIVIHDRAVIGNNVSIGTCVTIGGTNKKYKVPVVGDNTIISTGAKILGEITIGENCVIGANSVVIMSIPDNSVVVGVPGKIVKENINMEDYRNLN